MRDMRVESTNGVKFLFFSDEGWACARRKMKISHSWGAFLVTFLPKQKSNINLIVMQNHILMHELRFGSIPLSGSQMLAD